MKKFLPLLAALFFAVPALAGQPAPTATAPIQISPNVVISCPSCLTQNQIISLTGDITGSGRSSIATTLATVNSSPGSYGDASHVATYTVNGKGLVTVSGLAQITPAAIGAPTTTGTGASGTWGIAIMGNAGTATALASTPAQCSAGQFSTGIATSGAANCAAPSGNGYVVGPISSTSGYVPLWNNTTGTLLQAGLPVATTGNSTIVETNGSGLIAASVVPTLNQNTTGTAANVTAASNSTLVTLSALSLPYSQLTGAPATGVSSVFTRTGAVTAQSGDYNTSQVTENTNLYFTNARAIAATLTGYVSGAGTISAADSILSAIQKLNGNIAALVTGVASVTGDSVLFNNSASTGAVTLSPISQTKNTVFAGPASGSNAAGTMRALVGADLPNPSASTLGGVESITSASHNWVAYIDTSGVPHQSQPATTDISGLLSGSYLATALFPAFTGDMTTVAGGVVSTVGKVNGVTYPSGPATNTVPVVTSATSGGTVTYEAVPNAALANSSMTLAGHSVSLGGTQTFACGDLSNGATGCSTATGTSGATIPLLNGNWTASGNPTFSGTVNLSGLTASELLATDGSKNIVNITALPNGTTATTQSEGSADAKVATDNYVNNIVTLSDLTTAGALATVGTIGTGVWQGTAVAIGYGGTGQTSATAAFDALAPSPAQGDVIYYNGTHWVALSPGTSGYFLETQGASANPQWAAAGGGGTITLGTSAAATNPQRSSEAGTGFYSDTDKVVEVAANGIEAMSWQTVASGVDYATVIPAATANPASVQLNPAGSDTNINLSIVPKGSGGVTLGTTTADGSTFLTIHSGTIGNALEIDSSATYGAAFAFNSIGTGQWDFFVNTSAGGATDGFCFSDSTGSGTIICYTPYAAGWGSSAIAGFVYGWNNQGQYAINTRDTGLSRDNAGVVDVGTGGQGSVAGTLNAAKINIGTTTNISPLTVTGAANVSALVTALDFNATATGTTSPYQYGGVNALWFDNTNANVAIGSTAMITALSQAGASFNGSANTAIGLNTLHVNGTGYANVAIGGPINTIANSAALYANTIGHDNGAFMPGALNANTTGSENIAAGAGDQLVNATGQFNVTLGNDEMIGNASTGGLKDNTGVGEGALNDVGGSDNTAIGYYALSSATTGSFETAVGEYAGRYINDTSGTTTLPNVAVGYVALNGNSGGTSTGIGNVGVGAGALFTFTSGGDNTAIGDGALQVLTTGANNTAIGFQVGNGTLTTGTHNVLIGTSSTTDTSGSADTNEIAINGVGLGSNTTEIGLSGSTTAATIYGAVTLAGGLVGVTSGSNATAGNVGEVYQTKCPNTSATVTITIASPAVITYTNHGMSGVPANSNNAGICAVSFSTSGSLPTGITAGTVYYTIGSSLATSTFEIATSEANAIAGTAVNTTGSQSGTQTGNLFYNTATNSTQDASALNLPAGDWSITSTCDHKAGGIATYYSQSISTASGGQNFVTSGSYNFLGGSFSANEEIMPSGPLRLDVSSATPVYAETQEGFSTSTMHTACSLFATRMR